MFKSTRDFDVAVCTVLKDIMNSGKINFSQNGMSEAIYGDILEYISTHNLYKGFVGGKNADNVFVCQLVGEARITREGLAFIERIEQSTN